MPTLRERVHALYWRMIPLRLIRYHAYRVDRFVRRMALEYDRPGTVIVDIGSEDAQYRKYFHYANYRTQDIQQNRSHTVDIIGDLNTGIPAVADNSVDSILCTQVLEHIREPHRAFAEFHRMLKLGGKLYLTTHQSFEEHMIPYDYFRFTRYGLRYLGETSGFRLEYIAPHGGVFQVLAVIIDTIPVKLWFKTGIAYELYAFFFTIPILLVNSVCGILDLFDRDKIMTLNYECIYQKEIV